MECAGQIRQLQPNEKMTIPAGQPHQWWNTSDSEVTNLVITIEPAFNFEDMMEQIFGICSDRGALSFMQIMVMAREYDMVVAGPPVIVQKIMQTVLSPVGRLLGYKKFYPEYSSKHRQTYGSV